MPLCLRGEKSFAEDYRSQLAAIAKTYRLEIISEGFSFPVKTKFGQIDGANAPAEAVAKYAPLFALEFNLYPPSLIEKTGLKRIVLCDDVAFAGQRRNAIPDFENDTLYLDVRRGDHSPPYLRKVIHHEFFHIIDMRDDGKLYRDERWAALNPQDFRYGAGGRNSQTNSKTSVLTDEYPGFLNHYSTTGVEEDKAEIFANLIVDAAHVATRAKTDAILESKIKQLHALLADFCPDMTPDFWRKAAETKR